MFTASAMDQVEKKSLSCSVSCSFNYGSFLYFLKPSADFLIEVLNVPFIKIGSGDTNNFPMIEHIAKTGKPIVLSTGELH